MLREIVLPFDDARRSRHLAGPSARPASGGPPVPASVSTVSHTPVQVDPGMHSCTVIPLQLILHAVLPPQVTVQAAAPAHSAVHPPLGQAMSHMLSPRHVSVEPWSRVIVHLLPPSHVTLLSVPVDSVQSLVPPQLEVQFELQVPAQTDCPSHVLVQPVPQVVLQLFCSSQL